MSIPPLSLRGYGGWGGRERGDTKLSARGWRGQVRPRGHGNPTRPREKQSGVGVASREPRTQLPLALVASNTPPRQPLVLRVICLHFNAPVRQGNCPAPSTDGHCPCGLVIITVCDVSNN